jgi:hypothetical protein
VAPAYPDSLLQRTFTSRFTKTSTIEPHVDWRTGKRLRRPVDCWDVAGRADGIQWFKRFRRAGLAQTWKEQLGRDFAAGRLLFDFQSKHFIAQSFPPSPRGLGRRRSSS